MALKYLLEVEKQDAHSTTVLLKTVEGMETFTRRFLCTKDEAIHFTVLDGEIKFVSHSARGFFGPTVSS